MEWNQTKMELENSRENSAKMEEKIKEKDQEIEEVKKKLKNFFNFFFFVDKKKFDRKNRNFIKDRNHSGKFSERAGKSPTRIFKSHPRKCRRNFWAPN